MCLNVYNAMRKSHPDKGLLDVWNVKVGILNLFQTEFVY
jgi:hypothetical protein